MKRALITGITRQDGSFLAEFLLERGYEVFGLVRGEISFRPNNASHLADRVQVLVGDMAEGIDASAALQDAKPGEIYNPGVPLTPRRILGASAGNMAGEWARSDQAVRSGSPQLPAVSCISGFAFRDVRAGICCTAKQANSNQPSESLCGCFVRAMWLMLQQDHPDDFVIGTGKLHTLKAKG